MKIEEVIRILGDRKELDCDCEFHNAIRQAISVLKRINASDIKKVLDDCHWHIINTNLAIALENYLTEEV